MTKNISSVREKVERLLSAYPITRDNDKLLFVAYLVEFHNLKAMLGEKSYLIFKSILMSPEVPSIESMRRMRQDIQSKGQFVGTKRKLRKIEATKVREMFRGEK